MMPNLGSALLAFVVAGGVAALELVTTKYPRIFFILWRRSWAFWAYSVAYGVIALGAALGLSSLADAQVVRVEGFGLGNPWVQAVAVGLTARAFLHIRLFTTTVGSQSVPVGLESLVQLFEPWLLSQIDIDAFEGVREFVEPRAEKHSDLGKVRQRIRQNVPGGLPEQERIAFLADVDQVESTVAAMERYLGLMGRRSFDRVFPP